METLAHTGRALKADCPLESIANESPGPFIILNERVCVEASATSLRAVPPQLLFSFIIRDGAALEK